ncbi:hypothetical protein BT63DRAFT_282615 [Microthyrium microscopicum]|uniref:Uncharacterized protein n=1 Tax=Microthyrium microscopicum TaxID=703497 RepID=A0A6A6UC28_9PEZI|nr:hypothetical protein BT63DRAFT_282615 [Microthyrium microscopicum]
MAQYDAYRSREHHDRSFHGSRYQNVRPHASTQDLRSLPSPTNRKSMMDYANHGSSGRSRHQSSTRGGHNLSVDGEPRIHQSRSSRSLRTPLESSSRYHQEYDHSKRRRWPPSPSVEDEVVSLSKEYRPHFSKDNHVQNRGTIDQDPLIIELVNLETRFMLVSEAVPIVKRPSQNEFLKSEVRGRRQAARKTHTPSLRVETEDEDLLAQRKPSPYSFTREPKSRMTSGDYFLSPETNAPPTSSSVPRSTRTTRADVVPEHNKRSSKDSDRRSNYSSDSSDVEPKSASHKRSSHATRSPRTSFHRVPVSPAKYGQDVSSPLAKSLRKESSTASMRRQTAAGVGAAVGLGAAAGLGVAAGLGLYEDRSDTPKASVLNPPAAQHHDSRSDSYYNEHSKETHRHESIPGAYPSSPRLAHRSGLESPSGRASPRMDSRPGTPQSPRETFHVESPRTGHHRTPSFNLPINSKPAAPSKLSTSMRRDSGDAISEPRSAHHTPSSSYSSKLPYPDEHQRRGGSSLPYPDAENFVVMPSANTFLRSDSIGLTQSPAPLMQRTSSASSYASNSSATNTRTRTSEARHKPSRPSGGRSRTNSLSDSEARQRLRPAAVPRSASVAPTVPPSLSPCPRREFSSHHNDWWSLANYPNFDCCPSCLEAIVRPSKFHKFFVPAQPRPGMAIRCDMGSPWARLAWLLTMKQQRKDLKLLYELAAIWDRLDRCSEDEHATGPWYTLIDENFYSIHNFFVCSRDKANIEALFPSMSGAFTRVPQNALRSQHLCTFRTSSRRFPVYLDMIDVIHDRAAQAYLHHAATSSSWDLRLPKLTGTADTRPLIELAKSLSTKHECPRDRITDGIVWHYIPDCPDLTICPECYEDTVRPDLKLAPSLSSLFTRTPQPLAIARGSELTCQLYSPRMQIVWDRAVENDDVDYLVRKLSERRSLETNLKRQRDDLQRLLIRHGSDGFMSGGIDSQLLKRDLSRVEREWKEVE